MTISQRSTSFPGSKSLNDDLNFLAEFGAGATDSSSHYAAFGLAFHFDNACTDSQSHRRSRQSSGGPDDRDTARSAFTMPCP